MTEPRHGTALSEARIRTLLVEIGADVHNLSSGVHSDAFRSEEWPRGVYALDRTDMDAVLALLDQARTLRITPRSLETLIDPGVHTPARVRGYLAANGWTLELPHPQCSEWQNPRYPPLRHQDRADTCAVVMVLDWDGFSDYARRVADLAVEVAGLHGVGELRVLKEIEESADA